MVEQIHLRGSPGLEQVNHPPRFGRKVWQAGEAAGLLGCRGGRQRPVFAKQGAEGDGAQAETRLREELPSVELLDYLESLHPDTYSLVSVSSKLRRMVATEA